MGECVSMRPCALNAVGLGRRNASGFWPGLQRPPARRQSRAPGLIGCSITHLPPNISRQVGDTAWHHLPHPGPASAHRCAVPPTRARLNVKPPCAALGLHRIALADRPIGSLCVPMAQKRPQWQQPTPWRRCRAPGRPANRLIQPAVRAPPPAQVSIFDTWRPAPHHSGGKCPAHARAAQTLASQACAWP